MTAAIFQSGRRRSEVAAGFPKWLAEMRQDFPDRPRLRDERHRADRGGDTTELPFPSGLNPPP